jgi:two-component sensor histidine kinase
LSDLSRGDVFLFTPGTSRSTAVLLATAQPQTVPSINAGFTAGEQISHYDEPAALRSLERGATVRGLRRFRPPDHGTLQDVYPIRQGERVIGSLAIEVDLGEIARLERKGIIYRRSLDRLRRQIIAGRLLGASCLTRLGERDGTMIVTREGEIVYISAVADQIYRRVGYTHSLWRHNLGKLRTDESVFRTALESNSCCEVIVQEGPYTWRKRAIPLFDEDSGRIWNRVMTRFDHRDPIMMTISDVTDESQKQRELRIKSAMIQEIHHRVKNNLQTIAALLRLQARRTGSAEVSAMLEETINRILSIAVVHEFLARQESGEVNLGDVARQIISEVSRSILDPERHIRFVLDASDIYLPTQQATSVALVLNELLHNAVEHAFATTGDGTVNVHVRTSNAQIVLEIADDGGGLPASFSLPDDGSLGLQIVQTLVREDLKGTFHLMSAGESGARGIVSFPRVGPG